MKRQRRWDVFLAESAWKVSVAWEYFPAWEAPAGSIIRSDGGWD